MTLTAMVTGFPPELKQPKPLPGENISQLVIRNHPQEWRNCIERLTNDFGVSPDQAGTLRNGRLNVIQDTRTQAEIERFMNFRLPSHGRTMRCLKEVQAALKDAPFAVTSGYQIVEILWPKQSDPSGDQKAERIAENLGVKVISTSPDVSRHLSLVNLLPHVHGELLWLVPGGTRFMAPLTMIQLLRMMKYFKETPRCAMYMDGASSIIYRTSALRDLTGRGQPLSPESREMARNLELAGYELAADYKPESILCELEPEYGGPKRREIHLRTAAHKPWWKRISGW